jgi:hypothetical protein
MAQSAWHYAPVADRHDSDREVLTSLPRTRPVRRSAKRGESPRGANATKPKPKPRAAAANAPKARTTAAKPQAAAPPRSRTAPRRAVPPAGYASPSQAGDEQRSASADVIGTAVQAATELAQIGCAVGRQALQSMLDRLPKP